MGESDEHSETAIRHLEIGKKNMDNQERFELLSAYLDRELSPEEREKVERWLREDQTAQKTYQNLLQLRYYLQKTPIPSSATPSDILSQKVTTQAHRRSWKQGLAWSGSALAAVCVVAIAAVWSANESPFPDFVQSNPPNASSLTIAVNQPILEIPTVNESQ